MYTPGPPVGIVPCGQRLSRWFAPVSLCVQVCSPCWPAMLIVQGGVKLVMDFRSKQHLQLLWQCHQLLLLAQPASQHRPKLCSIHKRQGFVLSAAVTAVMQTGLCKLCSTCWSHWTWGIWMVVMSWGALQLHLWVWFALKHSRQLVATTV